MNKTETKKLAALVAGSANQQEAMLTWFAKGNTITPCEALSAGIRDAKRVVNRLRASGVNVNREKLANRKSTTIVYSLADKQSAKVRKALALA